MLLTSAAMLTACSSDDDGTVNVRPLSVEINCGDTRADITKTSTLAEFKMYGADRTYNFEKTSTGWISNNSSWPSVGNDVVVDFYAYDGGVKIDNENSIDVTVAEDAFNQKDILYAKNSTSYNATGETGKISLTFDHACAALAVSMEMSSELKSALETSNRNLTVTRVVLKNVKNSGRFNLATKEWSEVNGTADYTLTNSDIVITPADTKHFMPCKYLFMIPQSLNGASLEVSCKVGTSTKIKTLNFPLDNKTLTQNKKDTLNIILK